MIFYYKDKSVVIIIPSAEGSQSGKTRKIGYDIINNRHDVLVGFFLGFFFFFFFFDVFLFCLVFGPSFISLFGSGVVAVLV